MNGNDTPLYSFEQCTEIDRLSIQSGICETSLMGNAAIASMFLLKNGLLKNFTSTPDSKKPRLIFLCGSGNNGGDGLALAWFLLSDLELTGLEIKIYIIKKPKNKSALFYFNKLEECNLLIKSGENFFVDEKIKKSDIIIEALLGSGQNGSVKGLIREILDKIFEARSNWNDLKIISLDIPAGLSEDSISSFQKTPDESSPDNTYALPNEIHCYGVKKAALALNAHLNTKPLCKVLPIGFHANVLKATKSKVTEWPYKSHLKCHKRSATGHKYNAGHGILIAGSAGMEGAVLMSARAFFATGGGILHVFVPENTNSSTILNNMPSLIIHPINKITDTIKNSTANQCILIGPGLDSQNLELNSRYILDFLNSVHDEQKIILDAASTKLIHSKNYPESLKKNTLLTPHTGEWKKLGAQAICNHNQLESAIKFQEKLKCMCLIKDSINILLSDKKSYIYPYPNPRLSIAGSGDVLAGILLRLFASEKSAQYKNIDLIHLALYLHHKAFRKNKYYNINDIITRLSL